MGPLRLDGSLEVGTQHSAGYKVPGGHVTLAPVPKFRESRGAGVESSFRDKLVKGMSVLWGRGLVMP